MKLVWYATLSRIANGIPLIAFTADGKWLAAVGADGGIRCWH